MSRENPNLSVEIGRIKMKNPVMVASGCFGYGEEYRELVDLNKLGAIVTKSITLKPLEGNLPPRVCETSSGMLNAIGLQNLGVEKFISEKLPFLRSLDTPTIVSIAGESSKDYSSLARRLGEVEGVSGIELNISCPNVKSIYRLQATGYRMFAQDAKMTYGVVKGVRKATKLTVITKLSPNVTDIGRVAIAAQDGGSDAISLINSVLGMAVGIDTKLPKLANVIGGLTGPAIKPIALRCLWEVKRSVDLPLIGMGGIMDWRDALEFIITGATAVACGTANFVDPTSALRIVDGISEYMKANHIGDINSLVGTLKAD